MIAPTDPADLGAMQARLLMERKELSAEELAKACIARVEAVDSAVNALVARDFERVLQEARALDALSARGQSTGPLHGLPFGVKDMIDVEGLPTTYGSTLFRAQIAHKDDPLVAALRRAGGLAMGKTNTPEWSAGGNTRNRVYGVTRNPHDLTRSCAGSSGGSGAGLAAGYFPLATGSDTGGSSRNPAAFCGVVGFRPSPGVVPGTGRPIGYFPLSLAGPMARSVADAALMLSAMMTADARDPYTVVVDGRTAWRPEALQTLPTADLSNTKACFTDDYGFAPTEGVIREHFWAVTDMLAPLFGQVQNRPPDCTHADRIFSVLRGIVFVGIHGKRVDQHPAEVGPNVTENVREGRSFTTDDIAEALTWQGTYYRNWQGWFESHDVIISPTVTISPRSWREPYPAAIDGKPTQSYYHWLALAYASTIAGHPAITLPCGRDPNGMPFGLQIVGRRHDDLRVLAVAAALESVIAGLPDFSPKPPDLAMLRRAPSIAGDPDFLSI